MLTFKVSGDRVMFFCGNNIIGFICVSTFQKVNIKRVVTMASSFRDFGTLSERETVIRMAYAFIIDG